MPQIQAGSLYAAKIGHLSPAAFDIFGAVHQKLFTIFKAVPDRSRLFKLRRIKILPPPISASRQICGEPQKNLGTKYYLPKINKPAKSPQKRF